MIWLVSTIISIVALFLLVDAFAAFITWQSRIHIGRWQSRADWQCALEKKCRQWLWHTPTVSIKDEHRLILWDMLLRRYKSSTIQAWQKAALLLALDERDVKEYADKHTLLDEAKDILPEHALLAYALKVHNVLREEDEAAMAKYFDEYDRQKQTIAYRAHVPDLRFVDTIGFVCPYLYHIGKNEQANRQIEEMDKVLFNGIVPPHAFDTTTDCPMGIYDWSRGIGWYILGLIASDDNKERIVRLATFLLQFQHADGGFNSQVFNKGSRFESSGTVLIGLLMLKAYELAQDTKFKDSALRIERCLMSNTRRDGTLDFAQGDTKGIGHYSIQFDMMPFAQGMCLYFSKQLNQYEG